MNCIGALSFLRLEEEYWRSPFLINFIGVIFEAGNETREKIWGDFVAEQNEEWNEKESEKLRCEKNSVSEQNFLFTCGILKQFFLSFF